LLGICGAETLSKVLIYYFRLIMCEVIYVDSKYLSAKTFRDIQYTKQLFKVMIWESSQ